MFYKVIACIGVFSLSLACGVYSWTTYRRYTHEVKAWDQCRRVVSAQFEGYRGIADEELEAAVDRMDRGSQVRQQSRSDGE